MVQTRVMPDSRFGSYLAHPPFAASTSATHNGSDDTANGLISIQN
jgi:hypothetical protein